MDWSDVGGMVAKAAPLVGSMLGGPAGGAVGGLVAKALGSEATPEATVEALKADPEALERVRKLEMENERDLTRMHLEAETARLGQVNKTMRAEAASNDGYVRRWRPTFGYAVALAWVVQAFGIIGACLYAAIASPTEAGPIINAVGSMVSALGMQWAVALSVLGVNVAKRSQDKQVAAGQQPGGGLLGAITKRLGG
jgi:hypothetical protein